MFTLHFSHRTHRTQRTTDKPTLKSGLSHLCLRHILSSITSPRILYTPSGILGYHIALTWNFQERDALQRLSFLMGLCYGRVRDVYCVTRLCVSLVPCGGVQVFYYSGPPSARCVLFGGRPGIAWFSNFSLRVLIK
jgi:hypothetical protein